jgi:hypothetical protein
MGDRPKPPEIKALGYEQLFRSAIQLDTRRNLCPSIQYVKVKKAIIEQYIALNFAQFEQLDHPHHHKTAFR